MPTIDQQKNRLRSEMRSLRGALNFECVQRNSRLIQAHALSLKAFHQAQTVACYLALPTEVQTDDIIQKTWEMGKNLLLPAFAEDRYQWVSYTQDMSLVEGPFGVPQPDKLHIPPVGLIDVAFVPGMAFDAQGNRLGHGKGFFDRLLSDHYGTRCGLAFSMQLLDAIPHAPHDIAMTQVVTEDGVQVHPSP